METNFKSSLGHIIKSEDGFQDDTRENSNKLLAKLQGVI